jgi:hypothetical protein
MEEHRPRKSGDPSKIANALSSAIQKAEKVVLQQGSLGTLEEDGKPVPNHAPKKPDGMGVGFGEIDLGGEDDSPSLSTSEESGSAKDKAPKATPTKPATARPVKSTEPPPVKQEQAAPSVPASSPPLAPAIERPRIQVRGLSKKSSGGLRRAFQITVWILVLLGLLVGALYGVQWWQEHQAQQKKEELNRIDQSSLDSMKEQALKNDKLPR